MNAPRLRPGPYSSAGRFLHKRGATANVRPILGHGRIRDDGLPSERLLPYPQEVVGSNGGRQGQRCEQDG